MPPPGLAMGQIWRADAPPINVKERRHQEGCLLRVGWCQVMLAGSLLNKLSTLSALAGCYAEFERSTW